MNPWWHQSGRFHKSVVPKSRWFMSIINWRSLMIVENPWKFPWIGGGPILGNLLICKKKPPEHSQHPPFRPPERAHAAIFSWAGDASMVHDAVDRIWKEPWILSHSHIPESERLWSSGSLKDDRFKSAGTTKSPKEKELERSRNTTSGTSTWHWTIYHLVGIVDDCNQEPEIVNCQVHIFSCPMRHSTRNGHHLLGIHEHLSPFVYLSDEKKNGG